MYPQRELNRLAVAKSHYDARIRSERARCVGAAKTILRPVAAIDRVLTGWRALSAAICRRQGL